MMRNLKGLLLSVAIVFAFTLTGKSQSTPYPANVGDIAFNPKLDDPGFKVCHEEFVFQYYNFGKGLQYKGEKTAINEFFKEHFNFKKTAGETGLFTIRFIVNCEGETGRFRWQGMDLNYNPKNFNADLQARLLSLTRQLDGWIVGQLQDKTVDYYQYLTFKLVDGELIEIMP